MQILHHIIELKLLDQSLSHVQLFATPWTAERQASVSFTVSWSLFQLMSIVWKMLSSHLILCLLLFFLPSIFPSSGIFSNESTLYIRWPKFGVSASESVLPMNIQDWLPLGLINLISLLSKGISSIFSNTTIWKHQFFGTHPSL